MKIGLLSDTHGYLDEKIFHHFQDVDEIWHAGDIGNEELLAQIREFKPSRAVFGNIDPMSLRQELPEDLWMTVDGLDVFMTHIGGTPPRYNQRVRELFDEKIPSLFITGHSHILKVVSDKDWSNMLYINPGAAGNQGFHRVKTIMKFSIDDTKVHDIKVIELGRRG